MKVEEAIKLLENTDHLHEPPNGYYEALDMAIEALRNEINCVKCVHYTERETPTGIKGVCKMDTAHREELISRSRAIEGIREYINEYKYNDIKWAAMKEAEMLIESIPSAELTTNLQPSCNQLATDLISRQDAINEIKNVFDDVLCCNVSVRKGLPEAVRRIEMMPSADRPTGHWVEVEDYNGDIHYQCDQCGEEFILIDGTPEDNNYWHCPNCGSYNGGGEAVVKGADNESTL